MKRTSLLAAPVLALVAGPALAHTGHGAIGMAAGLHHPFSGADHLLAMVAVGLWAAIAAPRLFWVAPAGFLTGMLLGGVAGMAGVAMPGVEAVIAASIIVFGALAAFAVRAPVVLAFAGAAFFGTAHGIAHGAEMPHDGSGLTYALGFLLATTALHALGVFGGMAAQRLDLVRGARIAAGVAALGGVGILATS